MDKIKWIEKLVEIMSHLRSEEGCPWDRKQTIDSLRPCIIEECAELVDSIEEGDTDGIKEELGDVLMLVVLQSQIAKEQGLFDINDVAETICEKMIRRHPHVFGDVGMVSADEVPGLWDSVKSSEKPNRFESIIDGVPRSLPPLMKATEIQKKAAKSGFEWQSQNDVLGKIEEELVEVRDAIEHGCDQDVDEEIGDLLFAVTCLARYRKGKTADVLLNNAIKKFSGRFKFMEKQMKSDCVSFYDLSLLDKKKMWDEAKKGLEK